jgi:hypothetical protein
MSESNSKVKSTDGYAAAEQAGASQEEDERLESVSLDIGPEDEEMVNLDPETMRDLLREAQQEEYANEVAEFTDDGTIQESLEERQKLDSGQEEWAERLKEHHASSPALSGGDLDAAWDEADVGDETAGGTAATPDQDRVDEFGQALGIEYKDGEPLHTGEKLAERDRSRWELDPNSTEEDSAD